MRCTMQILILSWHNKAAFEEGGRTGFTLH